jgi:hypothetical protein
MSNNDPVPLASQFSTDNLEGAPEFYTKMYPDHASVTEVRFEVIKYFSLMGRDGEVLVGVLQKHRTPQYRCYSDAQSRFS